MIKMKVHEWQYNGVAQWDDIVQWCYHNLEEWSTNYSETIVFFTDKDYSHFCLRWS